MMNLLIASLATFGLAALLSEKDGPFGILSKLRKHLSVLDCVVCASVWIAPVVLALLAYGWNWFLWSLAVVGVVILIERNT